MNTNDSTNKIKSIYNRKSLSLNQKESIINEKNYSLNCNNTITKRIKSSKNKINNILKNNENCIPNFRDTIKQELSLKKNKTIGSKIIFKNNLVKKNKIIYLLRKLYIILPNNTNQMNQKSYPSNLFFNFYFPINTMNTKTNIIYIENPKKNDILCDDLNHILYETYKYLKLSIYDSIKMDLYDEKFRKIIKEAQLFTSKRRIIYVKITKLNEEEKVTWNKRINSKLFPLENDYLIGQQNNLITKKIPSLYRDVSTEYNNNDTKINNKNTLIFETIFKSDYDNNKYYNTLGSECKKVDEDNLINDNYEFEVIDNMIVSSDENNFLKLKKSRKSLGLIQKQIIEKALKTENKSTQRKSEFLTNDDQESNKNLYQENSNNYNRTISSRVNSKIINNNYKDIIIKKIKRIKKGTKENNKNALLDLIKKNRFGNIKNTFLPPLLFNFEVKDIINNKFILKYLTNKNRENLKKDNFKMKTRNLTIKNLNEEESSSHRNKIIDSKDIDLNSNKEENNEIANKTKINKIKFCNINSKIKEFIKTDIDNLLTKEETDDFKSLNCNYILINELKKFPITKLKKEFLFLTCISNRMKLKFEELFSNINLALLNKSSDIKEIFLLNEFDKFLNYLDQVFTNIINNKMYIFRYIGSSHKNLTISYLFFLLFIIYNKNLIQKNNDKNLIYIILECMDIFPNNEINFQQYCDYKLLMTENEYINFNKKFNFIKDFFLRVLIDSQYNKKILIKKLRNVFDINIIDIKNIFNLDMSTVKLKNNLEIYNKVETLYKQLIDYYHY